MTLEPSTERGVRSLTFLMFFLSGASALAYEVTWVRELSLSFGVSVYAVTAVLTAFMGGLALGSWLLGRIATRANPLRLYAGLQLGIALFAVLSPLIFDRLAGLYVWLYNELTPGFYVFNLIRFGLAALVLLVPATLMGGSFPVVSQFLARHERTRGSDLGLLYAANTLGGVIGTFATGLFLIRFLSASGTIYLAAAVDLVVALGAVSMSYRLARPATVPVARASDESLVVAGAGAPAAAVGATTTPRRSSKALRRAERAAAASEHSSLARTRDARLILWGFALSGFVALGYEVVWTRLLSIFTLNAVYSFTIMLTTFLVGLALGSLLISQRADRARQPLVLFGYLQLAIGLSAVLMLFVFARLPGILESTVAATTFGKEVTSEFIAAGLTMLVPTLLIGATFPVAARVYTGASETVGGPVGRLYSVNTVGAMLGSLVAGFGLIPLVGLQRAALILAILNLAIGAVTLFLSAEAFPWQAGGALAAAAVAALLLPPGIYLGFREGTTPHLVYYEEGVDATVSVFEVKDPPLKISFVNGRSEVPTDPDSMRAFYLLGHLPPLLKPDAQDALVVSFGNGIATGALSTHKVPRIRAIEIVAEQVKAAEHYRAENRNVLDYPGLDIEIEDGRNYLLRSREQFDIVTADATHPVNTSSWALFTREYYTLVRERLAQDGVFVQWLPFHDLSESDYKDIVKTFQSVFPHTTLWFTGGTHSFLVATPRPLTVEQIQALGPQLEKSGAVQDLGNSQRLAADLLMDESEVRRYTADASVVTDDSAFFIPARDVERIRQGFEPYTRVATQGQGP